jgi:hypothetical protein
VLRGDFEARATAYQQADYMTIAEKRRAENLPFIDGTDQVFVNAAQQPLDLIAAGGSDDPTVRRHLNALHKRMAELNGGPDGS